MSWLVEYYLWVKALHIISVIAWMAGLLYLPRLFVYHSAMEAASEQAKTFKIMERRLLKYIMHPAMIAALVFGFLLMIAPGFVTWSEWWLYAKLILVIGMLALHGLFVFWQRDFENDRCSTSEKVFRIANELPALLMILIVVLVVVKPF
ncbi:MAG: protoporphyrinogen oxidase HemJ [Pseudomonadota bacterium]|nr:protoporphyrinogen oxidase HemJ [Pseudomonadota bacterium]